MSPGLTDFSSPCDARVTMHTVEGSFEKKQYCNLHGRILQRLWCNWHYRSVNNWLSVLRVLHKTTESDQLFGHYLNGSICVFLSIQHVFLLDDLLYHAWQSLHFSQSTQWKKDFGRLDSVALVRTAFLIRRVIVYFWKFVGAGEWQAETKSNYDVIFYFLCRSQRFMVIAMHGWWIYGTVGTIRRSTEFLKFGGAPQSHETGG